MKYPTAFWMYVLGVVLTLTAGVYGWVANIITLWHSNFSEITGVLVLRTIGIFVAPLGIVLGYF